MPITINGNGTVTGIAVGGLPDGVVDTDMIATDAVTNPKIDATIFTSYAIITDKKSQGQGNTTFTGGGWRTCDLNYELADPDGIVSISSNQFTLQAGTYLIQAENPVYDVAENQMRLQNITDSTTAITGRSHWGNTTYNTQNDACLHGRITINAAKVFELQHYHISPGGTHYPYFGVDANIGDEYYAVVEIYKEG